MKKIFVKPEAKTLSIESAQIIAASTTLGPTTGGGTTGEQNSRQMGATETNPSQDGGISAIELN